MNPRTKLLVAVVAALSLLSASGRARAGAFDSAPSFVPRVPVSTFGLPRDWFGDSQLHVTTTMSMGTSSWGSRGMNGLQVTTLSYSFHAPVSMSVSLGNAWGANSASGRSSFFLEGLNLAYRPSANFLFQVQYQDLRSPLQMDSYGFRGPGRWGYGAY